MSLSDSIAGILKRIKGDVSKRETNTRALSALSAKEKLASVLAEISETVLPRALTFKIDDKTSLAMNAGGRRLLQIVKMEPGSADRSGDIAFATRNEAQLKEQVTAISELLAAFVKVDGALVVTSGKPDAVYSAKEVGFTVQELREACDRLVVPNNKPPASLPEETGGKKPGRAEKTAAQDEITPPPRKTGAAKTKPTATTVTGAATSKAPVGEAKKKPAAKLKPTPKARSKPAEPGKAVQAFLDANTSFCTGIAIISPDGGLERSTGASGKNPDWAQIAKDIGADMRNWASATGDSIGTEQLIILKSRGLGDQSMCYLYLNGHIVVANFQNSDLARVLSSVSRILNWDDAP